MFLSNIKSVQAKKEREIDTYYPNNPELARKTAEVLTMSAQGEPGKALEMWNEIHLVESSDNENLVRGVLLGELGKQEESAELLWEAYDQRPDSFIRALHWMVCVIGRESEGDGVARDSEILVRRVAGNWGENSIKSKALRASYAYFLDDTISYFDFLEQIIDESESSEDRFWAFSKLAEIPAGALPGTLDAKFHSIMKRAVREFPLSETFYEAWIAALYFDLDFVTIAETAKAEVLAGNLARLSVRSREAFVMSLLVTDQFEEAKNFYAASGLKRETSLPVIDLLGQSFDFEAKLRKYLRTEGTVEELADLEIMLEKIEETVKQVNSIEYPEIVYSFETLVRDSRAKLGIN